MHEICRAVEHIVVELSSIYPTSLAEEVKTAFCLEHIGSDCYGSSSTNDLVSTSWAG